MLKDLSNISIGVIGLGKLGLPCAEKMADIFQVFGYDIEDKNEQVDKVKWCSHFQELVESSDVIFIAVPTPHDSAYDGRAPTSHLPSKDFDYTDVKDVLSELGQSILGEKMVVLISTVLPGTIRCIQEELNLSLKNLVYNPFLIAMGSEANDFINPEMVILGNESGERDSTIETLINIYKKMVPDDTRFEFGTWEEAESIKIFYNTFISAKLSLVNMIQDVAQKLGHMNCDVVASALAQSTRRIMSPTYMKPGMGDGGPCHPRDNIALRHLAEKLDLGYDLFSSIMKSREKQAENLARFIKKFGSSVCILGQSFKPGVPYTDGSYSLLLAHYLRSNDVEVFFEDSSENTGVYLLAHRGEFYDYPFPDNACVIDPWREFPPKKGVNVIYYGNSRVI